MLQMQNVVSACIYIENINVRWLEEQWEEKFLLYTVKHIQ